MKQKRSLQLAGFSLISITFWVCFNIPSFYCARILGIFTTRGMSHFNFHETLMKSLLDSGHQVTIVAPYKSKMMHDNFTGIYFNMDHDSKPFTKLAHPNLSSYSFLMGVMDIMEEDCRRFISMEELKDIQKVDVIFVEIIYLWRCYMPLAKKLGVPVIGTTPTFFSPSAESATGIPRLPSVTPAKGYHTQRNSNFYGRLWKFWYGIETSFMLYGETMRMTKLYAELFPGQDMDTPKISLLFDNSHPSLLPRMSAPNSIGIGGINVKTAKLNPLPQHLKSFLDEAKEGVILFSLGSIITDEALNSSVKAAIIQTFNKIPHRVIWKTDEIVEGISSNVLLSQWVPQKEVLAHKNVVAFITHCGINSLLEAVYFGKPLILLPIWADQPSNAALIADLEGGKYLNLWELTEEKFSATLKEVINGTRYRERIKELSQTFKDDPISPTELVVYWTEYVIKHKGALHLRYNGADMPVYQYFMIDVIVFIFISFTIITCVTIFLTKLIFVKTTKSTQGILKAKKKKDS